VRHAVSVEIERPIEEVFAFVADPRNDEQWCPRVKGCEQTDGAGPGVGARYVVRHNPTFQRPHEREIVVTAYEPPARLATEQTDKVGLFSIDYELEPTPAGTRVTQRDNVEWRLSRPAQPIARFIVRRHMPDQLRRLKRLLERQPD
jgi:uncharacterized protein YndB with AHSA1/START domain